MIHPRETYVVPDRLLNTFQNVSDGFKKFYPVKEFLLNERVFNITEELEVTRCPNPRIWWMLSSFHMISEHQVPSQTNNVRMSVIEMEDQFSIRLRNLSLSP